MITIAPGIVPLIARKEWWHGKEAQCPECKTRVKLEEGDEAGAVLVSNSRASVNIVCPTAGCTSQFNLFKINPPFGETPP